MSNVRNQNKKFKKIHNCGRYFVLFQSVKLSKALAYVIFKGNLCGQARQSSLPGSDASRVQDCGNPAKIQVGTQTKSCLYALTAAYLRGMILKF